MGNGCFKSSDALRVSGKDVFDKEDAYMAYYHAKFRTVAPHRGGHRRSRPTPEETNSEVASTNGSVYTLTIQSNSPSGALIVKDKTIRPSTDGSPFILEGPECPLKTWTDMTTGSFVVIDAETGIMLVSVVAEHAKSATTYTVSTPDGRQVTKVRKSKNTFIMDDLGYKASCDSTRMNIQGPSTLCYIENNSQVFIDSGVADMLVVFLFNAIKIIEK